MKVLVSAYACEPDKGSEPSVGWQWVKEAARSHDVWVITRENNRSSIEATLERDPMPNVSWIYYDLPRWARFWKRGNRGIHLYYYLWQVGILSVAMRIHRQVRLDIVHHATFVMYWMPSFLVFLDVPFVWGPLGGGDMPPKTFLSTLGRRGRRYESLRSLAQRVASFDPFLRVTARRASKVLATTEETAKRLEELGARDVCLLSQVALTDDEIDYLGRLPVRDEAPFRVVSIGNLIDLKGFHLGIAAFARLFRQYPTSEYWIVGDGPERSRLDREARMLGVGGGVRFLGRLPRADVLTVLGECDALLHPSLHDSGGGVCAEAMAAKRPVVCLGLGGPGIQVDDETGYSISANDPDQAVQEMADALLRLATDPAHRHELGEASHRKVRRAFRWSHKGVYIEAIFTAVKRGMPTGDRSQFTFESLAPGAGAEPGGGGNVTI